jgi:hypothetical protein
MVSGTQDTSKDRQRKLSTEIYDVTVAQSATARNALGISEKESAQEIATMLYGEVHANCHFRFVRASSTTRVLRPISKVPEA